MDFLDPKKKRAHARRLYAGYFLITIIVLMISYLLMYAVGGYDVNRKTGEVFQNGLINIDSAPASAHIFINGVDKGTTKNRLIMPAGQYDIELRADGYKTWKHSLYLEGSSVEQLVYPFLFPEKLPAKSVYEFPAAADMASQSLDRRWLITHSGPSASDFTVLDLNGDKTLPAQKLLLTNDTITIAEGEHSFDPIEWSDDDVHLLVKHTFANGSEFILLDRQNPSASLNLTKFYGDVQFSELKFRNKNADQFYLFNQPEGKLFRADLSSKTPDLLVQNIASYKTHKSDIIIYVTKTQTNTAEVRIYKNKQDYLFRTLPVNPTYLIDAADFNGRFYVAVGSSADGRVYSYKDPLSSLEKKPTVTPAAFRVFVLPGVQQAAFSLNARFLAVQSGSRFVVYDTETQRQFRFDTKLALEPNQKAFWMDGHRITLNSGGKLMVLDFDGSNMQTLVPALPAFPPFFNKDFSKLYTIAPSLLNPEKQTIQQTQLSL